jgi:hypothetical protein
LVCSILVKFLSDLRLIRRNPLASYRKCRKKIGGAKVAVARNNRPLRLNIAKFMRNDDVQ